MSQLSLEQCLLLEFLKSSLNKENRASSILAEASHLSETSHPSEASHLSETSHPSETSHLSEVSTVDWQALYHEAASQSVFLLMCEGASKIPEVPAEVKAALSQKAMPYVVANMKAAYAISETDRMMRENGFAYLILKGISSASYYPDPDKRAFGDVDFLIKNEERDAVEAFLSGAGYEREESVHRHHVAYSKPSQHLEMHFDIPHVPVSETKSRLVYDYIENLVENACEFSLNGRPINVTAPKYHGLILILHMVGHFRDTGIGLRHLMDWGCYLDVTAGEPFWEAELLPLLEKLGLMPFTKIVTRVCAKAFGNTLPAWAGRVAEDTTRVSAKAAFGDELDEAARDFLADVMLGGNFGRRDGARKTAKAMVSEKNEGKIMSLVRYLDRSVRHKPAVKKHPILYPVYFVFIPVRRVVRVALGKRESLVKSSRYVQDELSLSKKLELPQDIV